MTKPLSSASISSYITMPFLRNHQIIITHFEPCCICAALFFEIKLVIFSWSRSLAWNGHQYQKVFMLLRSSKGIKAGRTSAI